MNREQQKRFAAGFTSAHRLLDDGSDGWSLRNVRQAVGADFVVDACDLGMRAIPDGIASYHVIGENGLLPSLEAERYDGILVSHVIEHLRDPLPLFAEWLRLLKRGGVIYIEAPSDRALLGRSHARYEKRGFFSFWDDPTHLRPWTPAAFYRLANSFGAELVESRYIGGPMDRLLYPLRALCYRFIGDHHGWTDAYWSARQFSCYAVIRKPQEMSAVPPYRYVQYAKD
jgi:SAM-dependent methyltransferase